MKRIRIFAIAAIVVVGGGWWYYNQPTSVFRASPAGELRASGTIEADEVSVTSDMGGRVVEVLAAQGDAVQANAPVARLDTETAAADLTRAQGALAEATARLDLAKNGARPEDKAAADAVLVQAVAARDGAKRGWDDALGILKNPQDLNARIDSARAQLAVAALQIDAAKAQRAQAEASRDKYRGDGSDLGKTLFASFDLQAQAAQESMLAATAQRDGAQTALANVNAIRTNPIDLQTLAHTAEARFHDAEAAVAIAQAARDLVYAGAAKQDVAVAQAAVAQAQAAVNAAQLRLDKLTLRAPASGRVSHRNIELGRVIAPGADTFTILDADHTTLTVYIAETNIGRIHLDQPAQVKVDTFPDRVFAGRVVYISSQAEFTPKNVQTVEGRTSQVFAVKIRLQNPDQVLKVGMPADAVLN